MAKYTPSTTQPKADDLVQNDNNRGFRYDIDRVAKREVEFDSAPTVNDDESEGYDIGATWVNTTTNNIYICVDNTVGAAIWTLLGTGATGPQGPQGPPVFLLGEPGEDGAPGAPGNPGPTGATGSTGAQGPPIFLAAEPGQDGEPGIPGATGPTGAQGPIGPAIFLAAEDGLDGDQGPQGQMGPTGSQGPIGPAIYLVGEPGDEGDFGPPGPQGNQGITGATGAQGPVGPPVFLVGDPGDEGGFGPPGASGPQGNPGATGSTGSQGPMGPPIFLVNDNDEGGWGPPGPGAKSPLTTKGDIYTYSTVDDRLPVGSNFQQLIANSSESTGLDWVSPFLRIGQAHNLEIGISGTTLTISGDGGTALSSTNVGLAAIRNSSGKKTIVSFTSNVTVTFGATSDTDGNTFGIASAADWGNTLPFFLGIIYDGTTPFFTISRVPSVVSGAAAADVCQKGDTDGDAQTDVMILTTGLTLANWVSLPITQVGWFKATWATATTAWTFSATHETGFNFDYEALTFTMPQAQTGTGGTAPAAGTHILTNGGTVPQFSTEEYTYQINRNGFCTIRVAYTGDAGTDGATAVNTLFAAPYARSTTASTAYIFGGIAYVNAAGVGSQVCVAGFSSSNSPEISIWRNTTATTIAQWQHNQFSNGARDISFEFPYKVSM